MPEISQEYQDFAREVAMLAVKHKLSAFRLEIRPPVTSNDGYQCVVATWEAGRHGDDSDQLFMEATQRLHLKVNLPWSVSQHEVPGN